MAPSNGPIERAIAQALRRRQSNPSQRGRESAIPASVAEIGNNPQLPPAQRSNRRRIHVATISERYAVTKWMVEQAKAHGNKHIASKTARQFPQYFPGTEKANLQKASSWWYKREQTLALKQEGQRGHTFVSMAASGVKTANFKALKGRGRKRSAWVKALYYQLRREFERLRSVGVKFSAGVLLTHARMLINEAPAHSYFNSTVVEGGKPIMDKLSIRWLQQFMIANGIVLRAQTGRLLTSPAKEKFIERSVAFHLGQLKRGFESGLLNENRIENADETHFIFNMDDGRTLGFKGENHVKYADVVSGGDPITMMVRLTGGANAQLMHPMLIFKNSNRSYPIQGVPDTVPGVCYRSGPKGWMDGEVFKEWLSERRAITPLPHGQRRFLYIDNCSGHIVDAENEGILRRIRTTIQKFPPNATHLIQPADSFITQKIKYAWRSRWEEYKYTCIKEGQWSNGSGKLPNPGKNFFLKLAAAAVRDVNGQRDKNGVQYARKAMIMTGMSLNLNGLWEESQLSDDLQRIVADNRQYFNGAPVEMPESEANDE